MEKDKVILGVDPGTNILGYGIIKISGKSVEVLTLGVIMLNKLPNHAVKLKSIFEKVSGLVEQYLPDEMAVEAPFFGKNVQSMLKLGRAQGVIMAAGLNRGIPIEEYSPRKIKQSITGKGGASKEQVAGMLESILKTRIEHRYMDATDGLAVALCHYYQQSSPLAGGGKAKSWDQFIKKNPGRISGK
ncbi:MAG: crossover junction endodeoxyribonuclease RuvC [Owenweeksia sp.]